MPSFSRLLPHVLDRPSGQPGHFGICPLAQHGNFHGFPEMIIGMLKSDAKLTSPIGHLITRAFEQQGHVCIRPVAEEFVILRSPLFDQADMFLMPSGGNGTDGATKFFASERSDLVPNNCSSSIDQRRRLEALAIGRDLLWKLRFIPMISSCRGQY